MAKVASEELTKELGIEIPPAKPPRSESELAAETADAQTRLAEGQKSLNKRAPQGIQKNMYFTE